MGGWLVVELGWTGFLKDGEGWSSLLPLDVQGGCEGGGLVVELGWTGFLKDGEGWSSPLPLDVQGGIERGFRVRGSRGIMAHHFNHSHHGSQTAQSIPLTPLTLREGGRFLAPLGMTKTARNDIRRTNPILPNPSIILSILVQNPLVFPLGCFA